MIPINKVYNLIGEWDKDTWNLGNCGIDRIDNIINKHDTSYKFVYFESIKDNIIKRELKLYTFNLLINMKNDNFSTLRTKLRRLNLFIDFISINKFEIESLSEINYYIENKYEDYLKDKDIKTHYIDKNFGTKNRKTIAKIPIDIKKFLDEIYRKVSNKTPDLWDIEKFNISKHRINSSNMIKALNFYNIDNEDNKEIIKRYIKYLILDTQTSLSFIQSKIGDIKKFFKFFKNKTLQQISRINIEEYKSYLLNSNIQDTTYNRHLLSVRGLMEYCVKNGELIKCNIYTEYDLLNTSFRLKGRTVEKYVIDQILNNIESIPKDYSIMYLMLYCTGMRISEICQLNVDCLKKDSKGFYIVYYQQKMKKEVSNPIPENLYRLMLEQKEDIIKRLGNDQKYLFCKDDGTPILSNTFRAKMKSIFKSLDIRTSEGNLYNFRPHEYRHTFATNLLDRNVPFAVIQKLLHHKSPEMSLNYVEITGKRRKNKYIEFIDILGNKTTSLFDKEYDFNKLYEVQWLKKELRSQALPNGYCTLPTGLGKCPYSNKCLSCSNFKTTPGHINILMKQLSRINYLIECLEKENNEEFIKNNIEIKNRLESIINSIYGGDKN